MKQVLACLWIGFSVSAPAAVTVDVDPTGQRCTFMDGRRPVLTYHYGLVPVPEGVGGKYAVTRSNYVHPVYGPNGEVLTNDFSRDHPHHRGIYWAWPEVTYKGEKRDLHALQGVFARPVGITVDDASLKARHVWKWGDREPIVNEAVVISVAPLKDGLQVIDFSFEFNARVPGITIARRGKKTYGGLNMRLSARMEQAIVKHAAFEGWPVPEAWAELTGIPPDGKEPIGVFLLQHPSNPSYPGDWVDYPNLNWLQPTFPASGIAHPLELGKPLKLGYRVIIRSGQGLQVDPKDLYSEYGMGDMNLLKPFRLYRAGTTRKPLTDIENRLRRGSVSDSERFEQLALDVLRGETSPDFRRWALKMLVLHGSEKSVPLATELRRDPDVWMQAADVIIAHAEPPPPEYGSTPDGLLRMAERSTPEKAAALYQDIMKSSKSKPWHRAAALIGWCRVQPDKALARVKTHLGRDDRHVHRAALRCLQSLSARDLETFRPGFSEESPDVMQAILRSWGDKQVRTAEAEAMAAMNHEAHSVRIAAMQTLGKIGGNKAAQGLLNAASGGDANAERALASMKNPGVVDALRTAAVKEGDGKTTALALKMLHRHAAPGTDALLLESFLWEQPRVTREAARILRTHGQADLLPQLRSALLKAPALSKEELALVLMAICKRQPAPVASLKTVLKNASDFKGGDRAALLAALPVIGGADALAFVTLTRDEAAIRALVKWPDEGAVEPLFALAKDTTLDPKRKRLATLGYVKLCKEVLPRGKQAGNLARILPHLPDEASRTELKAYLDGAPLKNPASSKEGNP